MDEYNRLLARLEPYDQQHLLQHWSSLSDRERSELADDIDSIDIPQATASFTAWQATSKVSESVDEKIQPVDGSLVKSATRITEDERSTYEDAAFAAIREGSLAVILLAGGQGTRLGVNFPKGMYDVGLPSHKTLFQLQAERIKRLQDLAGSSSKLPIVWYIMTSETTYHETEKFFHDNNYFGLDPMKIKFFSQGTQPCLDRTSGKILMSSTHSVCRSPDGNGGLYKVLAERGIITDMEDLGVKYVHVYCVDNILVKVADPLFCGFCITAGVECGNKVVVKTDPAEKVGITCVINERMAVVEYSEISASTANLRCDANNNAENSDVDGLDLDREQPLVYRAANICNHFFTTSFLHRAVSDCSTTNPTCDLLPYHVAEKKIPHFDGQNHVQPDSINGIKLERFVFDIFPLAKTFAVWECDRETEFAPLKNKEGDLFTPAYCRAALLKTSTGYLTKAGFSLPSEEVEVEVSPLVSYSGENLESNPDVETKLHEAQEQGLDVVMID